MDSITKSMLSNTSTPSNPSTTTPLKQSPRNSVAAAPNNNYQVARTSTDTAALHTHWQHTVMCYIFHVELKSTQPSGGKSSTPPGVRQRTVLTDLGKDVDNISVDVLDSLIVERLGLPFNNVIATESKSVVLSYLMQCFRRATEIYDSVSALKSTANKSAYPAEDDEKQQCVDCISTVWTTVGNYSTMCMTDSSITPEPDSAVNELYRLLHIDAEYNTRTGLPVYYLAALCKTDDAAAVFKSIIEKLKQNIIQIQYNAVDYEKQFESIQALIVVLINLTQHKLIANLVTDDRNFLPVAMNGRQFQLQHLLGPLMSCATPPNLPAFQNAMSRPGPEVLDAISSQRTQHNAYQRQLCRIFDQLIKADKHSRERTLSLVSTILRHNAACAKMHYNHQLVASPPYMYNVSVIMLHLVTPIVDEEKYLAKVKVRSRDAVKEATIAQFNKIALNYYLNGTAQRVSYDGVTRIGATQNDVNLYKESHDANTAYNFITECFAMTHETIHIGFLPITRLYLKYQEQLQQVMGELRNYQQGSPQYSMVESQRNIMAAHVLSLRVHLDDTAILEPLLQFYNFTSAYIAHTVHTSKPLALIRPEYMVEDTIEYYTFLARFQDKLFKELYLSSNRLDGLFDMMLTLGYGEDKLTNFHLRGKFAELLFLMLPRSHDGTEDVLSESHVFYHSPALQAGLIPLLIDLFIEVEFGTNQFYAKFSSRYYIAEVIKHLYTIPCHKQKLIATLSDIEYAVKLLNALANDVIYLLDDALKNLSEIHELELEQDAGQWNSLTADELKAKQKKLKDAERGAKSTMNLGNAIVHMLHYLTIDIVEPFVSDVMVERIATIITYYIDKLIGNTVQDLKVKDKAKYSFQPRVLLSEIIQIFINLSVSETFLEKVAADERSYSKEIWAKAARTLRKRQILPEHTIQKFEQLSARVAEISDSISNLDEILGDVPDEYCDALIGTIMTNPVLLPSSKQVVDKATIQRHLMNTPSDPFNRAPLSVEQLIAQPELEAEIKQWVEQRKKEYKEQRETEREEKRKELLAKHEADTAEKARKAAEEANNAELNDSTGDVTDTQMSNGTT